MFCKSAPYYGDWGHWVSKRMSRWWGNACLDPSRKLMVSQMNKFVFYLYRSFATGEDLQIHQVAGKCCCFFLWQLLRCKQICGYIQQVASTAHWISAEQRCFCWGKLLVLLSMCTCVHEQNIQINGNLCWSFASLQSAGYWSCSGHYW